MHRGTCVRLPRKSLSTDFIFSRSASEPARLPERQSNRDPRFEDLATRPLIGMIVKQILVSIICVQVLCQMFPYKCVVAGPCSKESEIADHGEDSTLPAPPSTDEDLPEPCDDFSPLRFTVLLRALQTEDMSIAHKAATELRRRVLASTLAKVDEERLIDVCLKRQGQPVQAEPNRSLALYTGILGDAYSAGALSENQNSIFFGQLTQFEFNVPSQCVLGTPMLYELKSWSATPPSPWWIKRDWKLVLTTEPTAGAEKLTKVSPKTTTITTGRGESCGAGSHGASRGSFSSTPIGKHELAIECTVSTYTGDFGDDVTSTLQDERVVRLSREFVVLPIGSTLSPAAQKETEAINERMSTFTFP